MASPHDELPHEHPEPQRTEGPTVDEGQPEAREADLLSLALLVFFVALVGVVGALLLVPVLF